MQLGAVPRKKKRQEGKKTDGCGYGMAGRLFTVLIGEDTGRALPRKLTVFFSDNQLYEKALRVVGYDGHQIAYGLCELARGIVHALARKHTRF